MSGARFFVEPTYAAGHTDGSSFRNLTADQAEQVLGAFLSDIVHLEGRGCTRVTFGLEDAGGPDVADIDTNKGEKADGH